MLSTAERRTTISLSPPSTPRLRTQPPRSSRLSRTLLDGGWWPRTADPVAELPGLILALDNRYGPITRIMLRRADWDSHPRRLRIDDPAIDGTHSGEAGSSGAAADRVVRLGWFDTMPAGLLTATSADGRRADLLTIPPHTSAAAAQAAMEQAADPGNLTRSPGLVSALTTPTSPTAQPQVQTAGIPTPEDTWESEGGRLRDHLKSGASTGASMRAP